MQKESKRTEHEIVIVEDDEQLATLPTIQIKCPKCEYNLAFWWSDSCGWQMKARSGSSVVANATTHGGSTTDHQSHHMFLLFLKQLNGDQPEFLDVISAVTRKKS